MVAPVVEKDTLEKIVSDAIAKEQEVNTLHPERKGYGMTREEADEFIRRIETLEYKLERAQKEKVRTRKEKIRMIGRDKLYTRSPEDIVIEQMSKRKFNALEDSIRNSMSERTKQVYDLNELGVKQVDIARQLGISQPTVHREIKSAKNAIKDSYKQWREDEDV